ncbi:dephospho-CoA kinase [Psychromonas sp. 14N.309.X.WAT.B.A12]|uniref:dephospho-CoA kinase n=1 Tax=Psychromonas sp. 14N.309.X.WAT.B.A12 TaxID=2998322 RepID=UPI0025AFD506|nr:dephospho-CoA kinase [Psychromonas sp. 14N.309.X.WAT.B.A12]MDN2663653.1 dephospho-CoA kinase [Psychromonas sp. 14N.309.X.WAT.B.A12]
MRVIIGLTGGIGSGKSTVANEFKALGVEVVDADLVAREVVAPGQPALAEIELYFGKEVIDESSGLNRAMLRQIIFSSDQKKQWLNNLLHPLIREALLAQLAQAESQYVILEAPLLLENKLTQYTDFTLVVDVPETLQIERAMQRDNNSRAQIQAIIDAQISRSERRQQADYIIDNSKSDLVALKEQVKMLHLQFLSIQK